MDEETAKRNATDYAQQEAVKYDAQMKFPDDEKVRQEYIDGMNTLAQAGYAKAEEYGKDVTFNEAIELGRNWSQKYNDAYMLMYNESISAGMNEEQAKWEAKSYAERQMVQYDADMKFPDDEEGRKKYIDGINKLADEGFDITAAQGNTDVTFGEAEKLSEDRRKTYPSMKTEASRTPGRYT